MRPCTTRFFRQVLRAHGNQSKVPLCDAEFARIGAEFQVGDTILDETFLILKHGALKKHPFVTGHAPTIVDIAFYCEVDQLCAIGTSMYDVHKHGAEVEGWLTAMRALPHHDEVRRSLFKAADLLRPISVRARAAVSNRSMDKREAGALSSHM
jgi:glutathione S-transferase